MCSLSFCSATFLLLPLGANLICSNYASQSGLQKERERRSLKRRAKKYTYELNDVLIDLVDTTCLPKCFD